MSETVPQTEPNFTDLGLPEPLLRALNDVGYEAPSPIQAQTIPPLLLGKDVLGQAQTGTGKTAAFALPVLARIDLEKRAPQVLILTPTRELAIQVAEAFQKYAAHLKDFHVLPIYGGQDYRPQLQALRRGAHVIVGTPGRVIDHMDRGTLKLDELSCLVLDEADEMLRMGFIDDVEKVLKNTPSTRQVALFSATMPPVIRRIAQTYLKAPVEITIRNKTSTVENTRQRYWMVSGGMSKLDALTRILEAEAFDGMIIFVRTRQETTDLAGKLEARGFGVAPLSGDIDQKTRERTVNRLKKGDLDIIVATDVAARGLDVERISHVINYDVPTGTESYVHRIGRTGRAGRSGEAILFVMPRERHMLRIIERSTRQSISAMELPSAAAINEQRLAKLMDRISDILGNADLEAGLAPFKGMVKQFQQTHQASPLDIAAALAHISQGDTPLLVDSPEAHHRKMDAPATRTRNFDAPVSRSASRDKPASRPRTAETRESRPRTDAAPIARDRGHDSKRPSENAPERARPPHTEKSTTERPRREEHRGEKQRPDERRAGEHGSEERRGPKPGMDLYRLEVGTLHGVQTSNIVGAIANEAEMDSKHIGHVDIREDHSLVELPSGMPKEIFQDLQKVWVAGRQLSISKIQKENTSTASGRLSLPHPEKVAKKPHRKPVRRTAPSAK